MKSIIPLTVLKERRISLGDVSQASIADQLGVATSLYGGIERGQLTCSKERAAKIAKILKAKKETLFKVTETDKNTYKAILH